MLESAAHELRPRGIRWTVVLDPEAADVTFRQTAPVAGRSSGDLYAELTRPGRGTEQVRIDGPLRSAAMAAVLSRIARSFRPESTLESSSAIALRWLDAWSALAAHTALVDFSIGGQSLAILDVQRAQWHSAAGLATPDIEALLDRMVREGFTLSPASGASIAPAVPLKPLLWQLALTAGAAGLVPALAQPGALRLKGWPYLAAGGPRSFGELIRRLRGTPVDVAGLRDLGLAQIDELQGFLNACHVCGYLQIEAPVAFAQRATPAQETLHAASRRTGSGGGRVGGVIASIRRSLGIGAE